jgi:hypothetical protein
MIGRTTGAKVATWFGFTLMCLGMFMAILDIQVVATLSAAGSVIEQAAFATSTNEAWALLAAVALLGLLLIPFAKPRRTNAVGG